MMKRKWTKKDSNWKEKKQKTKFEEYLEWDMGGNVAAGAEDDVKVEKRLAKKLKMKSRSKLGGPDDGMNFLIGESTIDPGLLFGEDPVSKGQEPLMPPMEDDVLHDETEKKRKKKKKSKQLKESESESESEEWEEESELRTSNANEAHGLLESAVNSNISHKERKKKNKSKKMGMKPKQLEESESEELELGTSNANEAPESAADSDVLHKGKKKKRDKRKEKKSKQPLETESEESEEEAELGTSNSNVTHEPLEVAVSSGVKYLGPHQRATAGAQSAEHADKLRLIKGHVNRLTGLTVESITQELATIFQSLPRNIGCQMIIDELLKFAQGYADSVPFAACVAGMACLVGVDFSAKFLAALAKLFEDLYANKNEQQDIYANENENRAANLTRLLCYMYMFGVCSSDLIYDLLTKLSASLTELDAFLIKTVLNCCGWKLRSDCPSSMKDFILNIRERMTPKYDTTNTDEEKSFTISKRMQFDLEIICDNIKNNKKRSTVDPADHTRVKKWLQKLNKVSIILHGLKWKKLLDPEKKGQWWISGENISLIDDAEDVGTTITKDILEDQKLVQLAASQGMNTATRKAIFCIIMSAEDYLDAFEKLLRLNLSGKQDREIVRVLVECCLQEKLFNKYYPILASKLCTHNRNNKFSLQYCIWDHYKELESMELRRSLNLAKFVAELLSSFSLSLAILKPVDLANPTYLIPKRIMHFKVLFEALIQKSDAVVWNVFTRVAVIPELEEMRANIMFFMKRYVVDLNPETTDFAQKVELAKKAFNNVTGVLM